MPEQAVDEPERDGPLQVLQAVRRQRVGHLMRVGHHHQTVDPDVCRVVGNVVVDKNAAGGAKNTVYHAQRPGRTGKVLFRLGQSG
jgi:hypothetical protein